MFYWYSKINKPEVVMPITIWNPLLLYSETTWAPSVRGGGKNPSTFGLGIFAPTLNLVVS